MTAAILDEAEKAKTAEDLLEDDDDFEEFDQKSKLWWLPLIIKVWMKTWLKTQTRSFGKKIV